MHIATHGIETRQLLNLSNHGDPLADGNHTKSDNRETLYEAQYDVRLSRSSAVKYAMALFTRAFRLVQRLFSSQIQPLIFANLKTMVRILKRVRPGLKLDPV